MDIETEALLVFGSMYLVFFIVVFFDAKSRSDNKYIVIMLALIAPLFGVFGMILYIISRKVVLYKEEKIDTNDEDEIENNANEEFNFKSGPIERR